MSRSDPDNLGLCVLAIVAVIFVTSSAALADVEVSVVDKGTCTQTFKMLLVEHQPPPPARDITQQINYDRTSLPPVNFTDLLSTAGLGQSVATNYCQSTDTHIPPSQAVRQLPAGPGGATLFLFGVGCLGAVKLGRSARSLHLQSLPEWFHTGGPIQIGHVSVLDLDARVLLAPHHDQSPSDGSARFSHSSQPLKPIEAQCFLTTVDVRGPPELHI